MEQVDTSGATIKSLHWLLLLCLLYPNVSLSEEKNHWGDKSHALVCNSANGLVNWIDRFFYSEDFEVEAAEAYMRLRLTHFSYEARDNEFDIGFRGRVSLPALSKRFTLVIYDNEEEDQDRQTPELTESNPQNDHGTNVAIQFTEFDEGHHRLDYRFGVRSSGAFKSAFRYRYRFNLNDQQSLQVTNRLRFRADEGFENRIQLRHDTMLSKDDVLRIHHTTRYGKITRGMEWHQYAGITHRLNDTSALTGFIEAQGITQPNTLTTLAGLGFNYRKQFFRDWMYIETRPAYYFERETKQQHRDGRWRAYVRLEMVFD